MNEFNFVDFGTAINALKDGKNVARIGWNGKGMFIYLNKGSLPSDVTFAGNYEGVPLDLFNDGDNGTVARLPNLNMKTPTGSIVTGWLASQTDILAEDWIILE